MVPEDLTRAVLLVSKTMARSSLSGGTTDSYPYQGYAVTRYNSDGSLDTAFGNGGIATYFFPSTVNDQDGLLQPDGKILVIGFGGEGGSGSCALYFYWCA